MNIRRVAAQNNKYKNNFFKMKNQDEFSSDTDIRTQQQQLSDDSNVDSVNAASLTSSTLENENHDSDNKLAVVKLDEAPSPTNQEFSSCNKNFSLLIVSITLLLDGMLNMVIIPIIPEYVKYLPSYNGTNATINKTNMFEYDRNDVAIGFLFASKPFIQLVIGPFSGSLIDAVGYEFPTFFGLIIQFISTMVFTYSDSLAGLFISRSLQGLGSALSATGGFTMIAVFFKSHFERSKALGIVITSLALGSFMSVPFSGFMFEYVSKKSPFIALACLALFDAVLLLISIYQNCNTVKKFKNKETNHGKKIKKRYIWTLFLDPYIAICSVSLIMANVPLAFTQPTIAIWMKKTMNATESQIGLIWLSGFLPHLLGVYLTVYLIKYFSQHQWLFIIIGIVLEALSCLSIPFITSYNILFAPICIICFSYGLIDATVLPTMAFLVDTRHASLYGSVYAIVDISYSLVYAFGPMLAGVILNYLGFLGLTIIICFLLLSFSPFLFFLKKIYLLKMDYEENQNGSISVAITNGANQLDEPGLTNSSTSIISSGKLQKINNHNYVKFQ